MKKNLIPGLVAAGLALGAASAHAVIGSCSDPIASSPGERFCLQSFDDLATGTYKVSFDYQAERLAGSSDKTLFAGWAFDSAAGPLTHGKISDSTTTPGWQNYSFVTQAGGDARLLFAARGIPSHDFGMSLQNIQVAAVPEPGTYAMLLAGLAAIGFVARRRRT